MRFKLDENLPVAAADVLRHAGFDALTIFDQKMIGESDPYVASVCQAERRALITLDLDFSDIRTYPPSDFAGIIVLRPSTQGSQSVLDLVERLVPILDAEALDGNLWILDEIHLRIREGERSPDANA